MDRPILSKNSSLQHTLRGRMRPTSSAGSRGRGRTRTSRRRRRAIACPRRTDRLRAGLADRAPFGVLQEGHRTVAVALVADPQDELRPAAGAAARPAVDPGLSHEPAGAAALELELR